MGHLTCFHLYFSQECEIIFKIQTIAGLTQLRIHRRSQSVQLMYPDSVSGNCHGVVDCLCIVLSHHHYISYIPFLSAYSLNKINISSLANFSYLRYIYFFQHCICTLHLTYCHGVLCTVKLKSCFMFGYNSS